MRTPKLDWKLFFRKLFILSLPLIVSPIIQPPRAQSNESDEMDTGGFSLINAEIRAETSATLAAWNPETLTGLIAVRYVYPEGYHQIDNPDYFTLKPEPAPGIVFGPPLKEEPQFKDNLAEYFNETTILIEFRVSQDTSAQRLAIDALFQICNYQGICLFPDSELQYVDFDPAASALEPNETTLAILDWSTSKKGALQTAVLSGVDIPTNTGSKEAGMVPSSFLLILLMALAGGVLLNIMPCILPLLSVKALNLVNQAGGGKKAIFTHSLLYVAGIEISMFALAVIVVVLRASVHLLGWGFQFQSPLFVLILIAIIWVFALSLFDVFVIEAPRRRGMNTVGKGSSFWGSFLTGVFAVLLAAPCTAPLLGVVLGFALSQTPLMIFAIFGLIGLGFGFPFLLLGLYPNLGKKLPKPGPWMNTFKKAMGFLLIGIAVYLFTTFIKLAPSVVEGALWWLLFLSLSAWLLGKARSSNVKFRFAGQILAFVIAVGSGFLLVDFSHANDISVELGDAVKSPQREVELKENAIVFDNRELQTLIAAGKPVFLEFSAAWCTICKINQRVIKHREIRALMAQKGIIHIKADLTTYDENLIRTLAEYGRASVPLYVLYRPNEEEPLILPTFISIRKLRAEMKKIH